MSEKVHIIGPEELHDIFAASVAELDNDTNNQVLSSLSRAIGALQSAGIDVTFEITGWVGADTFKPVNGQGGTATFSGFLNIGNNRHILSLLALPEKTILALSYFNATLGIGSDSRMWSYDITDADCYASLQRQIVTLAARNNYMAGHDVANAFSTSPSQNGARKATLIKPSR